MARGPAAGWTARSRKASAYRQRGCRFSDNPAQVGSRTRENARRAAHGHRRAVGAAPHVGRPAGTVHQEPIARRPGLPGQAGASPRPCQRDAIEPGGPAGTSRAAPSPTLSPSPAPESPTDPPRARILLAEDNPVNQRVALHILRKRGFEVHVAHDGRQALEAWRREPFDLVLMDVQMPEMDGFAAVDAIRAEERGSGRHTPIVALTAEAFVEDRERCLAAGMDAYVSKPFTAARLWEVIDRLLAEARAA
jgi:CheY-like chemotaxis protein